MRTIDLNATEYPLIPAPKWGTYAALEGLFYTIPVMLAAILISNVAIGIAESAGWPRTAIKDESERLLFVTAILIGTLIAGAGTRYWLTHTAIGTINGGIATLATGATMATKQTRTELYGLLNALIVQIFFFLRNEQCQISEREELLKGNWPINEKIWHTIERKASEWSQVTHDALVKANIDMRNALAGIASRRAHPLLRSRYVVNAMFPLAIVLISVLSITTSEENWVVRYVVTAVFAYGICTVISYVRHLANNIGYKPGDFHPHRWKDTASAGIKASLINADTWHFLKD